MKYEKIKMKNGTEIIIPNVENYKDCFLLIQSDLYRIYEKKFSAFRIMLKAFSPFSSTMIWFRLCKHRRGFFFYFARVMYKLTSLIHQIDIPYTTKIGFGFYTGHTMCIVINRDTIIGNNVGISQFVNIGTNHQTPAVIGDNAYIAPMVCLVENVEIGTDAVIGAGAVVTRDVPERCTAVGVPAKVISQNTTVTRWHHWDCSQIKA